MRLAAGVYRARTRGRRFRLARLELDSAAARITNWTLTAHASWFASKYRSRPELSASVRCWLSVLFRPSGADRSNDSPRRAQRHHAPGCDLAYLGLRPRLCRWAANAWVESERGAVTLGRACVFPPLSFDGALVAPPWLRFHVPLIEPDMQIYRIRLSDKTSRLRVRRPLQFLNTLRSC